MWIRLAREYLMLEESSKYSDLVKTLYSAHADVVVLYYKVWGCHWNVNGIYFSQLHDLFKEIYEGLAEAVDRNAENIGSLGYKAPSKLSMLLQMTKIQEIDGTEDAVTMVRLLAKDVLLAIANLKKVNSEAVKVNQQGVINMVGDLSEEYSAYLYKLRRTLGE